MATKAEKEKFINYLYSYFISKGASPTGAQYLLGSILRESHLDPGALEILNDGSIGKGRGIVQLSDTPTAKSFAAEKKWAKDHNRPWDDFQAQAEFIRNQNTDVWNEFKNAQPDPGKGPFRSESGEHAVKDLEHFGVEGERFKTAVQIHNNIEKGLPAGHGLGAEVSDKLTDLEGIMTDLHGKFLEQPPDTYSCECHPQQVELSTSAKILPKKN